MSTDPRDLVGGYLAGTLTDDEQRRLLEAALTDQALFDELTAAEPLRQLLAEPALRLELHASAVERPGIRERIAAWLRPPARWALAGGLAAGLVAVLAIRFLPVTDSVPGGRQHPSAGADSGSEFTARSFDPTAVRSVWSISWALEVGQPPVDEPSSDNGPQAASSQRLRPTAASEKPPRQVDDTYVFTRGERFCLRFEADFEAHVYLFKQAADEPTATVLSPQDALSPGTFTVPGPGEWIELGDRPGDETLVMVLAPAALPSLDFAEPSVSGQRLDEEMTRIEHELRADATRRLTDRGRVRLEIAHPGRDWAAVVRMELRQP